MIQFNIGDVVKTPQGRTGTIKAFKGRSIAIVWFTQDGTETGQFSLASLRKS